MTKTLQQIAQGLWDEERLNMEHGLFTPEWFGSPIHVSAIPFTHWMPLPQA